MFIVRFIGRILSIGLILFIVFLIGGKRADSAAAPPLPHSESCRIGPVCPASRPAAPTPFV